MDTTYKLILLLFFVFLLISNARTGKSGLEESQYQSATTTDGSQYSLAVKE